MLREEWDAANVPDFELPGNLVRQLELHEPPGSALPAWVAELPSTVKQLVRRWLLRPGRPPRIDPGLARARSESSRSLPATTGRSVLLCTDLHAGNVLAARGSRGSSLLGCVVKPLLAGLVSTRSPTSATRPTTRCGTCSTARTGSSPTRPALPTG